MTRLVDDLVDIARESGTALVIVHHGRKSDGKSRDSSAIEAVVDMVATMRQGKDERARKVAIVARFDVAGFSFRLSDDGRSMRLVDDERPLDERVLTYVSEHAGCSTRTVTKNVKGANEQVLDTLKDLVKAGEVTCEGMKATGYQYRCVPDPLPSVGGEGTPSMSPKVRGSSGCSVTANSRGESRNAEEVVDEEEEL